VSTLRIACTQPSACGELRLLNRKNVYGDLPHLLAGRRAG
jgi:hypothetical protein